jgi:hypothetical protein
MRKILSFCSDLTTRVRDEQSCKTNVTQNPAKKAAAVRQTGAVKSDR